MSITVALKTKALNSYEDMWLRVDTGVNTLVCDQVLLWGNELHQNEVLVHL